MASDSSVNPSQIRHARHAERSVALSPHLGPLAEPDTRCGDNEGQRLVQTRLGELNAQGAVGGAYADITTSHTATLGPAVSTPATPTRTRR